MIPLKRIREETEALKKALDDRGEPAELIDKILAQDETVRGLMTEAEGLKARRNSASAEIGALKNRGENADEQIRGLGDLSSRIKALDRQLARAQQTLDADLLWLPNPPHASVPVGADASGNVEVARWGEAPQHDFPARDQHDLLVSLRLVDFEAGARMSGAGFPLYTGRGARLERALINFMLDLQTGQNGYEELWPPYLVRRDAALTTGQLPKLEADMYLAAQDDLFLIPTAEVPVTNLFKGQVLDEADLPLKYAAYSACFRREAGSYGKESRGLLRVHQFNKVELVKFTHPDRSYAELETLRGDAEEVLRQLGLAYRVLELCSGDLSFAAAKCYDLELFAPVTGRWLEVSSCSNFVDFQARRGNMRFRRSDTGKLDYLHTVNGSGVATPRLMATLLEVGQQRDGSVLIPEALRPYFGSEVIEP